jgi:DNA repair protein RecN (Recombination protein N)
MLKRLIVENFVVIEKLELDFGPGLQALTGETGAGKSILVEALGFLLGERGHTDWIRSGADRLRVCGEFELDGKPLRLERELDAGGRSRARLDGKPATGPQLTALGEALADFHGQHEHQTLLKPVQQLALLDGCAGLDPLLEKLSAAWREHQELNRRLESMKLSEDERLRRIDLCRWQLEEIDKVGPKLGEEEELEAALPKLKNAEKLLEASGELHSLLYREEDSVSEKLSKAARAAQDLASLDPQAEELARLVAEAKLLVEEASNQVSDYKNGVDLDPAKLDEALGRQDKLAKLKKKYGPTLEEVLARREKAAEELRALENHDAESETLEKELAKVRRKLEALSDEAHDKRMAAAKKLSVSVARELQDLGMPGAKFSISVEMEEGALGPTGSDRVEFLLSPNPGEPLKALRAIASGGEMSRSMLALKTVLSKADRVPILVFDEVDAGVGGVVARSIGKKLAALAQKRQVLVVTHLPQVAAYADGHFHVSKVVASGRTKAKVDRLDPKSRLDEMARLLGGHDSSAAARKHAEELLTEAKAELAA